MHDLQFPVLTMADVGERELVLSDAERKMLRDIFALTPIQPIAYVGTSSWDAACTRLQEAICKAEAIGFTGRDIDAITEGIDLTCGEGLDDAASRLDAARMLSVAMPALDQNRIKKPAGASAGVSFSEQPERQVKPAISGLTVVR
jgi:hypothetical protein